MSGFGRSNSLSINTGASNSLFGAASKPPASGGLFSNTSSNPPTGNLFGQNSATTQPQSGGLFGQSTATSQPQSGGLFGQSTATSQPQSGGLFGQSTASQPQQSGGLFGNLQKPAQPASGGLFGTTQQAQPQQSTSLFGAAPSQQNQPQSQGGGLFGGLGQQNKPATPSLFGSSTTQQQPSLGSNTNTQQNNSLFGGSMAQSNAGQQQAGFLGIVGKPTQQQAQPAQPLPPAIGTVPGVRIDASNIKPTTRFSELHDDLQNDIVRIEDLIQNQISWKDKITAIMPSHAETMKYVPNDVAYLTERLGLVENVLDNDASDVQRIKDTIKQDAKEARLSFMAIENLKLPSQFHHSGMGFSLPSSGDSEDGSNSTDLTAYFNARHDLLAEALKSHEKYISEVEAHLKTVEATTIQKVSRMMEARERGQIEGEDPSARMQEGLKELGDALRAVEAMILNMASKVGEAREGVVEVTLGAVGR